jgi:hypothetical protein
VNDPQTDRPRLNSRDLKGGNGISNSTGGTAGFYLQDAAHDHDSNANRWQDLYVQGRKEAGPNDPDHNKPPETFNIEDYDFLDGAKAYKIYDIRDDDDDLFQQSTVPHEKIMRCLKIFEKKEGLDEDGMPIHHNPFDRGNTEK